MSPRKVWAVAGKELRQASRDPLSLAMLLGLPTVMLLMYGYAINFDVRHVRLGVRDLDKSRESRELVAAFVNSGYFDLARDLAAALASNLLGGVLIDFAFVLGVCRIRTRPREGRGPGPIPGEDI